MRSPLQLVVFAAALLAGGSPLHGAQLPIRRYTTADGLASNSVYGIASDSRGFLWFATDEGISRFDGFGFTGRGGIVGIPKSTIRRILIGRNGIYWLATPTGLIRFRPDLPPSSSERVVVIHPTDDPASASIFSLLEDRHGRLWFGTRTGLFLIADTANPAARAEEEPIGLPGMSWLSTKVNGLAEDLDGGLWIGVADGTLYHRLPDGAVERYATAESQPAAQITHLFADRQGRVWVGRQNSLERSKPAQHPGKNGFERLSGHKQGLAPGRVFDIIESRDGDVWVGMYRQLVQFRADGSAVHVWTKENGLPSRGAGTLVQDRDGNLWIGTDDEGAYKLSAGGVLTYSNKDRLGIDGVISIAETLRGELYFSGRLESDGFRVATRSGDGFQVVAPRLPSTVNYLGWRPLPIVLQDRAGEWWLATGQGLCRYPRLADPLQLAQTLPRAIYTVPDGLPSSVVTRLYEDHNANIWVSTEGNQFAYWSPPRQRFIAISANGKPFAAAAYAEDSAGHLWIGDEAGQLWRVIEGRAVLVPCRAKYISALLLDHAGRLWVATDGQGLMRFDQPAAAIPQYRRYDYSDGLSSLSLHSLAEDRNGNLYIGSVGAVDRLDHDLTHIRHYTLADGIAEGDVNTAYCDRNGNLWFGSNHGLTCMVPQNSPDNDPPQVWITGLSISGQREPISDAGESSIHNIGVRWGQEPIQFDFVGLNYSPGDVLRFQYRLGDAAWSAPTESRSVNYAALAPGQYQFAVRAITSDGEASPSPATVEFRVDPPLWRRTWFQAILLILGIAGAVSVHRIRAGTLLEIERVRSNIALDLHDDIASNLAQISIFSEIALREAGPESRAGEPLTRIAETARETVDCISDIVWSIRPQKQGDLSQRIRRFGSDALTSRQIAVVFRISEEMHRLTLDPNAVRQVYLIYKEAVHNTVRHAQATSVEISMGEVGGDLVLKIRDNGKGIVNREEGNGLPGMRERARSLGGQLAIQSSAGEGTEVELRAPIKRK